MDEAELAAYLADPYEELLAPPGPRGGAGELEGLLSLADINQRMLEYSAAHGAIFLIFFVYGSIDVLDTFLLPYCIHSHA